MRCFFLTFFFFVFSFSYAYSDIQNVQSLSFGVFAVADNRDPYQMTVLPNGNFSQDPAFVTITEPREAVFELSNFPAETELMINVTMNMLSSGSGGETFDVINPVVSPAVVFTNAIGEATFSVGATLQTSGNGGVYRDSGYSGTMMVSVNY